MSDDATPADGATPPADKETPPTAAQGATPPADGDTPKPPDTLGDAGKAALDAERRARREAERELKKFQEAERTRREAEMSDLEKAQAQLAELEAKAAAAEAVALAASFEREVVAAAAKHGLADPADAIALLSNRRDDLLADDGVEAAVQQIAQEKPYLLKAAGGAGGAGSHSNPGRRQAPPKSDRERLSEIHNRAAKPWYEATGAGIQNAATGEFISLSEIRQRGD